MSTREESELFTEISIVVKPRNEQVATGAPEQQMAKYQGGNCTQEAIQCRRCHWTEKFSYRREQDKMLMEKPEEWRTVAGGGRGELIVRRFDRL